jgi:hypothetical protein
VLRGCEGGSSKGRVIGGDGEEKSCERNVEVLNGKCGEGDSGEVTSVNQVGRSTNYYTSMAEEALQNLVNFKVGSGIMSS